MMMWRLLRAQFWTQLLNRLSLFNRVALTAKRTLNSFSGEGGEEEEERGAMRCCQLDTMLHSAQQRGGMKRSVLSLRQPALFFPACLLEAVRHLLASLSGRWFRAALVARQHYEYPL